jgi:type I restriction enzyme S subunit
MINQTKATGIDWIGQIPENWQLLRLGSLFKCRNVKVDDSTFQPLSVSKGGIVPQMDSVAKTDANDNRKQVLAGDFVINSRSDRKQSCGVSQLDGSVSLINIVLYQTTGLLDNDYVNFLLKNYGFAEEFYRWGHGIVSDLWTTRWQEMSSILIPVPPLSEQKNIIRHLSEKTSLIESLRKNEETQIEKLDEYRRFLITEAVTKGLNPKAPMVESGIPLVGKVPATWVKTRSKYIAKISKEKPSLKPDDTLSYSPMECIRNDSFSCSTITASKITSGLVFYKEGDVLLAKITPCFENGNVAIAQGLTNGIGAGSSELIPFTPTGVNPRFLLYYLQSQPFVEMGKATIRGIGGLRRVTPEYVQNFQLFLPTEEEQQSIVAYLDKKNGYGAQAYGFVSKQTRLAR